MKELVRIPDALTLRRMVAAHCPLALYYLFRLLTCTPAMAASIMWNAPDENLQFGTGLVIFAVSLGLIVAATYTVVLPSFMTGEHEGIRTPRTVLVAVVVGGIDMTGGLAAIVLSGGWGSPFWHAWLASLIIPCLIFGVRWSLVLAVSCIAVLTTVLSVTGEGANASWMGDQRHLYVGAMVTLFLLSGVVGYLGDVCFELQRRKVQAEAALKNIGTMLEITRNVAVITTSVNEMMRRVAQVIGERHHYDSVGIYLSEPDGRDIRLAGWVGDFDDLQRYAGQSDHLIHRAIRDRDIRSARDERSWSSAIPIRDNGSLLGVLLIASDHPGGDVSGVKVLESALTSQIAVGIRIAGLREKTSTAMTNYEWELLTGQIHNQITGSMYSLMLHLEGYSTIAAREVNPLADRLAWLLPHGRHLLFYTRQYVYRLLPVLRGEGGLDTVVESLGREFESMSGIRVRVAVTGSLAPLPLSTVVACYDIIQQRMGDILQSASASELQLDLDATDDNIRLSVSDDGSVGEENGAEEEGMDRIRRLVRDVGGEFRIGESQGLGTQIVMGLPIRDGNTTLDRPDNHRRESIPESRHPDGGGG